MSRSVDLPLHVRSELRAARSPPGQQVAEAGRAGDRRRPAVRRSRTSRASGRSSQASIRSVSSARGARRRARARADRLGGGQQRVQRRSVDGSRGGDTPAAASRPCRTTAISQPPRGRPAGRRPARRSRSARPAAASGSWPAAARPAGRGPAPPPRSAGRRRALDAGQQPRRPPRPGRRSSAVAERLGRAGRRSRSGVIRELARAPGSGPARPARRRARRCAGDSLCGALAQRQRLVDRRRRPARRACREPNGPR